MAAVEKKKAQAEGKEEAPRYAAVFLDNHTGVQIAAGTHDIDKFTKTDLMKMVKAFKDGVATEEKHIADNIKKAEQGLKDESNKRSNSKVSSRVRRPRKVRKP